MFGKLSRYLNIKRKTGSLLIAAQINTIKTNYILAKIDNSQKNSKGIFMETRDETVDYIISEFYYISRKVNII